MNIFDMSKIADTVPESLLRTFGARTIPDYVIQAPLAEEPAQGAPIPSWTMSSSVSFVLAS